MMNSTQPTETTQPNEDNQIDYSYEQFKGSHLGGAEPKERSFDNANGKVQYKEIPLHYNYGTEQTPIIDSCFFECPVVSSFGGIVTKRDERPGKAPGDPTYVRESYSMMFTFELQDPECVNCLNKLDDLHLASAQILGRFKGKASMYDFNPDSPGGLYKNPVYWKRDEVTGERVAGRNPSLWVKLNNYKNNKTLFTDLNENPIDWSLLTDVEIKMLPLIHVEKVYIGGGKASLQLKLVSAIITDIVPINTRTRQTKTIDRLKKRAGLADAVSSQLASLRMERQDALDGRHQPQNATLPESGETGQMHSFPNSGNSTMEGTQDSLASYLGEAPPVQQSAPPQVQTQPHQVQTQPARINLNQSQAPVQFGTHVQPTPVLQIK